MDNWCEYRAADGEIRNVLQFCCECDDVDDLVTSFVNGLGQTDNGAALLRILAIIQDRLRVPFPGGAVKMDIGMTLPLPLHYLLYRWAASCSSLWKASLPLVCAVCLLIGAHIAAQRNKMAAKFPPSWLILSIACGYLQYLKVVQDTLSSRAVIMGHIALIVMTLSFWHCASTDLGRIKMVLSLNQKKMLRAGYCKLCQTHVILRDHHCTWLGQCVGQGNRRSFFVFLATFSTLTLWFSAQLLMVSSAQGYPAPLTIYAFYVLVASLLGFTLCISQAILISSDKTTLELKRNSGKDRRQITGQPYAFFTPASIRHVLDAWWRFLTAQELMRKPGTVRQDIMGASGKASEMADGCMREVD